MAERRTAFRRRAVVAAFVVVAAGFVVGTVVAAGRIEEDIEVRANAALRDADLDDTLSARADGRLVVVEGTVAGLDVLTDVVRLLDSVDGVRDVDVVSVQVGDTPTPTPTPTPSPTPTPEPTPTPALPVGPPPRGDEP